MKLPWTLPAEEPIQHEESVRVLTAEELEALEKCLQIAIENIEKRSISDEHKASLKANALNHLAEQCRLYLEAQKASTKPR